MPRDYAFHGDSIATDAASTIATIIAQDIIHHQPLQERLNWLTHLLSRQVAGICGIGIATFCGGRIVAYSLQEIRLTYRSSAHSALANIKSKLRPDLDTRNWTPLKRDQIETNNQLEEAYVSRIGSEAEPSGMILAVTDGKHRDAALDVLNRLNAHVSWATREAVTQHFTVLNSKLQNLAFQELTSLEYEPNRIAAELASIFNADAATILARNQDLLFISATTDKGLNLGITYREGESLTDYIFKTGEIVNLDDGNDPREILRKTGVKREGPLHGESITQGEPFRFLGSPIVSRGKVRGVMRLFRKGTKAPFCRPEEEALARFGEVLGTYIYISWRMLLSNSLLDSDTDAVFVSRLEEGSERPIPRVIFASRSAERIFGREKEYLVGINAWDLYAPSQRQRVRQMLDLALRSGQSEVPHVDTKIVYQGSTHRIVEISYHLIKRPHFWPAANITIGIIRDITEKHRREEQHRRLAELLDQKKLAYFRADTEGNTLETSKAEEKITGYSAVDLQKINRDHLYEDPTERGELLEQATRDGGLVHTIQKLKKKDGTTFYAEGDFRILLDEETGMWTGYEGLYSDATDRVAIQELLDAEKDRILTEPELLQSLREHSSFHQFYISSLGHQLRTPLGSLVENLQNLKAGVIGLDRLEYAIGEARACALLASNLTYIDKILRAEKIDTSPTDFARLTLEVVIDFDHARKERGLKFDINRAGLDHFFKNIYGHRELLRQIVVVLIDNAIKYSFSNSTIRIDAKSWPRGVRVFEIYNSGVPVGEDIQERVFERGYRSPLAKDRIPHGTGMGLWLAKKIVEAHRAEIQCRGNVLGKRTNTVFRVLWTDSRGAR